MLLQINRKMVNTIWFRIDSIRFRKYLVLNQSKIGKYNLISVRFNKIWKIFLCIIRNTRVLRHPHSISLLASSGAITFGAKSIGKMCNNILPREHSARGVASAVLTLFNLSRAPPSCKTIAPTNWMKNLKKTRLSASSRPPRPPPSNPSIPHSAWWC